MSTVLRCQTRSDLVATFVVVRAKVALLVMLVVNKREQLRPDGLSSRSRTVSSLHPRSPNIKVKFKLLVLSYHRKPTLWLIKVKFQVKRNPSSFLCLEAYFFQEIPHPKLEEPRKAATLHFNKIWICNLLLKVQI